MNIDLTKIRNRAVPISQYIDSLKQPFKEKFVARKHSYKLNHEAVTKIKEFTDKYIIVAFSAEWCKDCAANIPVLAILSEKAGLEVRVFGGLMKDPLSHERKWRIPPSPPEVETFSVDKIPLIIVFDKKGNEIGRIIENPRESTLEEELLKIILAMHQ